MGPERGQYQHGDLAMRPRRPLFAPRAAATSSSLTQSSDRASESSARAGPEQQLPAERTPTFPSSNGSSSQEPDDFARIHPERRKLLRRYINSLKGPNRAENTTDNRRNGGSSNTKTSNTSDVQDSPVKRETPMTETPMRDIPMQRPTQETNALFDPRVVAEGMEYQRLEKKREQEERERSLTINGKPLFGPLTLAQMIDAHYEVLIRRPLPGTNESTDEKQGECNGNDQKEEENAEDSIMEE
ncbi:hypothetical protein F5B20DRAFT_576102 [Whalleya microplaca]|nr:hypothetical protein F5B20DRAFT_576102 [Whalleya microplaca]